MKYSEEDIIGCIEKGDITGMRMMFDNYYQALCVYALKYIDSFDDAEDQIGRAHV